MRILRAATARERLRGLSGTDGPPPGTALHLPRTRSVHTLTLRGAIDLVWLDGAGRPVRLDEDVAPRRMRTCLRARSVLEARAGEGARLLAELYAGRVASPTGQLTPVPPSPQ